MKVSVIITTCNREPEYLKKAIDSVFAQTYKNIEIIVVNDAPGYVKQLEIEELINSYKRGIKYYINSEQMGANYSRNYGVSKSSGDILSFLDDDDYWDSNRIALMVNRFKEGYDILYSDFYIFSDKGKKYSKRDYPPIEDQLSSILAYNYLGGFSNVAFTRSLFESVHGLDETMPSYQDQDLFVRLIQNGSLSYIPKPLSYYRIMPNSISLNNKKKIDGLEAFLVKYKDLYEKFPDSLVFRLESELVYAKKQGWEDNAKTIASYLLAYESKSKIRLLSLKGKLKYIAVKYLGLQ